MRCGAHFFCLGSQCLELRSGCARDGLHLLHLGFKVHIGLDGVVDAIANAGPRHHLHTHASHTLDSSGYGTARLFLDGIFSGDGDSPRLAGQRHKPRLHLSHLGGASVDCSDGRVICPPCDSVQGRSYAAACRRHTVNRTDGHFVVRSRQFRETRLRFLDGLVEASQTALRFLKTRGDLIVRLHGYVYDMFFTGQSAHLLPQNRLSILIFRLQLRGNARADEHLDHWRLIFIFIRRYVQPLQDLMQHGQTPAGQDQFFVVSSSSSP